MNVEERGEVRDDAFHITAAANMASIATEGFRVDRRGVLGTGAYFDLVTEVTGWVPARERYPDQPLIVFRCEVALGRVLDLDDEEVFARFQHFQRELGQRLGRDETLRMGRGGQIDEFLFESTSKTGITYNTIKRTFVTDGQTRIAVRDSKRIRVLSVRNEKGEELPWPPTIN
ncbi:hypothetical protein HYR99_20730 [Candidatus Poribacteria bacterium]|nr:hypothetical protein [Candidatus Poribacteria bacterium]